MRNPVKTAKRQLLRVGSCALSALMVLGSIPAAAIGDGVTATYDEAYYAVPGRHRAVGQVDDLIVIAVVRQGSDACPERRHDHLPAGRKGPARDLLL